MDNNLQIAYVVDNPLRYIRLLNQSIRSVKKYNPSANITVLSRHNFKMPGAKVMTFNPGKHKFRFKPGDRMHEGVYYKFWLPLLPYKKIIYLDCDTVCQRPLASLWNTPCDFICGTESHSFGKSQAAELGRDRYMLTGVMLMNLDALRAADFTNRCIRRMESDQFSWHDESVINLEFGDQIAFIDKKYNYCHNRDYDEPIPESDAYILHFVGKHKNAMLGFQNFCSLEGLKRLVRGKRVAVVGNACSILGTGNGKEIDNHDCIIRFNHGVPSKHPEDTGKKTTMVFLATTLSPAEIKDFGGAYLVSRSNLCKNKCHYYLFSFDRCSFQNEATQACRDAMGPGKYSQASTGFIAVQFALAAGAKSIDLYGFDFFKTDTWHHDKPEKMLHNGDKESEKLTELADHGLITIH